MASLTEETGEVARLMNHMYGTKKKKAEEAKQEIGKEICDVLFTLTCMANSHNIDLQTEWNNMMQKRLYGRDNARFERKDSIPQVQIKKEPRNAAKAFIIDNRKLLLLKRASNDVQMPSVWEIPGGRLELGEDPTEGIKREVLEETGLDIDILQILDVRHFTRADGQVITMLIFVCKPKNNDIRLSHEHSAFDWIPIENAKDKITEFFHQEIDIFNNLNLSKL